MLLLTRHVTQTETVNETLVAIINRIDRKETLIGRLEYSLPKKPYTSEQKTTQLNPSKRPGHTTETKYP
jgi:hypothetical protein